MGSNIGGVHVTVHAVKVNQAEVGVGIGSLGVRPVDGHILAGGQPDVAVVGVHQIQIFGLELNILQFIADDLQRFVGEHGGIVIHAFGVAAGNDVVKQQRNLGKAVFVNVHIAAVDEEAGVGVFNDISVVQGGLGGVIVQRSLGNVGVSRCDYTFLAAGDVTDVQLAGFGVHGAAVAGAVGQGDLNDDLVQIYQTGVNVHGVLVVQGTFGRRSKLVAGGYISVGVSEVQTERAGVIAGNDGVNVLVESGGIGVAVGRQGPGVVVFAAYRVDGQVLGQVGRRAVHDQTGVFERLVHGIGQGDVVTGFGQRVAAGNGAVFFRNTLVTAIAAHVDGHVGRLQDGGFGVGGFQAGEAGDGCHVIGEGSERHYVVSAQMGNVPAASFTVVIPTVN